MLEGVWAVGSASTIISGEALILHWDGNSWKIVPNPGADPRFYDARLSGVTALSANDVWAVGEKTTTEEHNMIEHWDGTKWSIVTSPAFNTNVDFLLGVSAISATDIWAVGSFTIPNAEGSPYQNATMHWDGTSWSIVSSPNPSASFDILTSVAAISASDVWAVGAFQNGVNSTLVLHWDGTNWAISPSPAASSQLTQRRRDRGLTKNTGGASDLPVSRIEPRQATNPAPGIPYDRSALL